MKLVLVLIWNFLSRDLELQNSELNKKYNQAVESVHRSHQELPQEKVATNEE